MNGKKDRTSKKVPSLSVPNQAGASSSTSTSTLGNDPKSPVPSTRRRSSARQKPKISDPHKHCRFQKKTFSHPTWCQYANKFIWGLNKSGYECRVCGMAVSRRFIAEAKKGHCGQDLDRMEGGTQTSALTEKKVFTIYLPHGAKKSIIMDPNASLGSVLEKVCRERGIDIGAFVPEDTNGKVLKLGIQLGKIEGNEITFTASDSSKSNGPPSVPGDGEKSVSLSNSHSSNIGKAKPDTAGARKKSAQRVPKKEPTIGKRSVVEAYEFGQELGSGAFSIVRSASHHETGKIVAIKILDKYDEDDEQTAKFKQEIAIISSLHHENIVQFYELDEDDENFYVVMELVGGGELFDFIIDNGALPENDAAKVAAQVLKAVEYMHSVGTAHRDLKPENLLFSSVDEKIIKIADFGESKSFKEGTLSTYCGTPDYMAPEIIRGDNYGPEVDVWAIGVITYVMLAGFPPFDGENDVEVFASILSIKYDFPSPEWDRISPEAKNFIQAILVDKPEKRLTASQALAHPWIVGRVDPELRVNKEPSATSSTTITTTLLNSKGTGNGGSPSSSAAQLPSPSSTGKITPPGEGNDKQRKTKRESRNNLNDETESGDLDLNKKPKKVLSEAIEDAIAVAEDTGLTLCVGELKSMKTVIEATTGKPKVVELEKVLYVTYWRRIKELQTYIKKAQKKKK